METIVKKRDRDGGKQDANIIAQKIAENFSNCNTKERGLIMWLKPSAPGKNRPEPIHLKEVIRLFAS